MNVYLVGMPGAGKSEVGAVLAKRLGEAFSFIDMDEQVAKDAGMSVPEVFLSEGEEAFRAREREVLERVAAQPGPGLTVVATGGGSVLTPENRERMRATGKVVWLTVDTDTIVGRVEMDGSRPLLRDATDAADLLTQREELYREAAHVSVDGSGTPDDVAKAIEAVL